MRRQVLVHRNVLTYGIGLTVIHDMLAGAQGAWFSELFPTRTRISGTSLGYQLSAAISGFIPMIASAILIPLGWTGGALVYTAYGALGLVGALLASETGGAKQRTEVDTIVKNARQPPLPRTGRPVPGTRPGASLAPPITTLLERQ
jgi:hypothetical protein